MKINKFEYSIGNKKIGRDTLIFNMGPATNCPSKLLGLCKHPQKCYALKAEKQYKQVLPYRERQRDYWLNTPQKTKTEDISKALKKHKKIKYVRFNESGDLWGQFCINDLANMAKNNPKVIFYGYTARQDLNFEGLPKNLVFNGSSFMLGNNFSPYHENYTKKCLGDCSKCKLCKVARGLNIKIDIH